MSAAKVADMLSIALKGNESGLSGVITVLQSKVGAAFAGYHQSLGEAVAVANEFSMANFTNTRQIASFVSKIGEMQGPMVTMTDTNGKVSRSTASWVDSLANVGLTATKVRDAFAGPDGLVNGLMYLKTAADGSMPKLLQYVQAIWGAAGTPAAMALIKNLGTVVDTVNKTKTASAGGLNTVFGISQNQIDNQLKELRNKFENVLQGVGMFLLPDVKDLANWTADVFKYFEKHPLVAKIASDAAIGLFAASVAWKVGRALVSVFNTVKSLFGTTAATTTATTATTFLPQIAANTALTAERLLGAGLGGAETEVGGAEVAGGGAIGAEGAAAAGAGLSFGSAVIAFGAGVAAFEATSLALKTSIGKSVGNFITKGGNWNPINDLANTIAGLIGELAHSTPNKYSGKDARILREDHGAGGRGYGSTTSTRTRVGHKVTVTVHR
jgi:hypothetical protein